MRWTPVVAALTLAPSAAAQTLPLPNIPIETYRLDNGLNVVLSPDRSTQVVTVDVWYNVGSRNEVRGRTGFAHLFEHMMFQGSANVKKGDHFALVERAGGELNGSTTEERTNYFQMLPSNRLNLGLWLEADRMRSLAITAENLNNQREAVKEERRLRLDNQPYTGVLFEGLYVLADSSKCFPYAHSVIGSMDDLNAAKVEDVKAFFDQYYAPNNATLVVTGDFEPAEAKQLIATYFGAIPRGNDPPPVSCNVTFGGGEIRRNWPDAKATLPAVIIAFRAPAYADADYPALSLLAQMLGQGESSRLNKRVVRERRLAQGTLAQLNLFGPRRHFGTMIVGGFANQGVPPDSLERALRGEIASIVENGVSSAELEKAKNGYVASQIQQQQISLFMAEAIQSANLFLGDPRKVNSNSARYLALTVDDIKRVAGKYLTMDNAAVFVVTPGAAQ